MCESIAHLFMANGLRQSRPDLYDSVSPALDDIKNYMMRAKNEGYNFRTPAVEGDFNPDALVSRINEARKFYGAPERAASIAPSPSIGGGSLPNPQREVGSSPIYRR